MILRCLHLKMTITIDELCEQLGINHAIPENEYPEHKKAAASYDLQGKWFDRKALPSTKAVAPIVCEQLQGVETAIELGAGTGFRVLYYAMNNPQTRFLAVDNDRRATDILKERIKKLKVPHLRVQTMDMYQLTQKYAALIAVDCFDGQGHSQSVVQKGANYLRLARLVDTTKRGAFFCTSIYNSFNDASRKFMEDIFREAGLPRVDTVPFEFVKVDGASYSGRMVLGKYK